MSRFDTADLHLAVTAHIVRGHKQRLQVDILDLLIRAFEDHAKVRRTVLFGPLAFKK
jgi:hypothetical protein